MFSFDAFLRFENALRAVYRLAFLNLLWLTATVLGLIVFGIGPASYALARYLDGWCRRGETPPPARTFVAYLRDQPLRATLVSWILLAAGAVIVANVFLAPSWFVQFFNVLALGVLGMVTAYVFPLMSATRLDSIPRLISGALLVGLGSLHWTALGAAASSAVLWLLWQASPLLAIAFGVAVPAAAIGLVSRVVLREFGEPTRDPAEPPSLLPPSRRRTRTAINAPTTQPTTEGLAR